MDTTFVSPSVCDTISETKTCDKFSGKSIRVLHITLPSKREFRDKRLSESHLIQRRK